MFAVKGVGRDHAKFSPVATAFYRLLPDIRLTRDVYDSAAIRLQKCFTPGVMELEPTEDGRKKAVIVDARSVGVAVINHFFQCLSVLQFFL